MITQKQMDELSDILFQIKHNCIGYARTPILVRDDETFIEIIRKQAHDIERWCDDTRYRKPVGGVNDEAKPEGKGDG